MIKVGRIKKSQVLWQAVFLAASLLAISGSTAKTFLFHAPTIPPPTQAIADMGKVIDEPNNVCRADYKYLSQTQFQPLYKLEPSALTPKPWPPHLQEA